MSSPNYTEWSKEEKDQLADKLMREMKEKNEKLLKRHTEVEHDRMEAESKNSAVTNAPKKKEKSEVKIEYSREWDRGKMNKDDWKSPERRASFKNCRTGHYEKSSWNSNSRNDDYQEKDIDVWGRYSKNEKSDYHKYKRSSDMMQNRKKRENVRFKEDSVRGMQHVSRFHRSPKRTRGGMSYRNSEGHKKPHLAYFDEKNKKPDYERSNARKYSYRPHSRSSSRSESEFVGNKSLRSASLWHNDKISEDETKKNRVENWVKSVSKSNWERNNSAAQSTGSYSKFDPSSPENSFEKKHFNASRDYKSRENNSIVSHKPKYQLNKRQSTGGFSYNVGTTSAKQSDRNKGSKSKHSPQYTSSKDGCFRSQRGFSSDGMDSVVPKSTSDERFLMTESSNADTWPIDSTNWRSPRANDDPSPTVSQCQVSDMNVNENTCYKESRNITVVSSQKKNLGSDGINRKSKAADGWDDDEYSSELRDVTENVKVCKISNAVDAKDSLVQNHEKKVEDGWDEYDEYTAEFKELEEQLESLKVEGKNAPGSDGWSTTSERECRSDDDDSEWKKKDCA